MNSRLVSFLQSTCLHATRAVATFAALTLLLSARTPSLHGTGLWLGSNTLPYAALVALAAALALTQLALGLRPSTFGLPARLVAGTVGLLCLADAWTYSALRASDHLAAGWPVAFSLLLALALLGFATLGPRAAAPRRPLRALSALAACGALGLLLHVLAFGATDYSRPADAAVVLGAAVRADGRPSQSLRDRTLTACDLYHRGFVRYLVLSGGRDPRAPLSEPAAMALIARDAGVPADALVFDEEGVDTRATVANTRALAQARGWKRVLMVSHDYHLARLSLASQQAGLRACTVPAAEPKRLHAKPWFVVRELAAYAAYLLNV
ncbi:MAG: YdcF family protein [Planctomycetota bacterium]|nr:YdcF family protein [Planctomycetota bacterium]